MTGVVLGFDFGQKRIGVAIGNGFTECANALIILDGRTNAAKWSAIESLIKQWMPDVLVVGLPCHPDGTPHELSRLSLKFARQLEGRFSLPVYMVDERYSSAVVENQDGLIDDEAAAVILQQWFDEGQPKRVPSSIILGNQ